MSLTRRCVLAAGAAAASASLVRPALAAPATASLSPQLLARATAALKSARRPDRQSGCDCHCRFRAAVTSAPLSSGGGCKRQGQFASGCPWPRFRSWAHRLAGAVLQRLRIQRDLFGHILTDGYYVGAHGRSIRLSGLDPSNANAQARGIVVHGAWYVSPEMARNRGVLGRSEGCFAFGSASLEEVMARLGPGHMIYADKVTA